MEYGLSNIVKGLQKKYNKEVNTKPKNSSSTTNKKVAEKIASK